MNDNPDPVLVDEITQAGEFDPPPVAVDQMMAELDRSLAEAKAGLAIPADGLIAEIRKAAYDLRAEIAKRA